MSLQIESDAAPRCPVAHDVPHADFDHHVPRGDDTIWGFYDDLLATGEPVHHTGSHGGYWVVSGYAETKAVLRDAENFTVAEGVHIPSVGHDRRIPHEFDGPLHAAYRDLIMQPLSSDKVRDLHPYLRDVIGRLLEPFYADGGGDFRARVALPLPLKVLTKVVGFSDETVGSLRAAMVASMSRINTMPIDQSYAEIQALCFAEVARHREQRPDDFITSLLDADVEGRPMTEIEIVRMLGALARAGQETTIAAAAWMVYMLAAEPRLQEQLRADPSRAGAFVEESLRVRPPSHSVGRTTVRDVEVGGVTIPAGERVLLVMAAANRDEAQFACPAEFDVDRGGRGNLTFGWGVHHCAGAALARAELRALLQELCAYPTFHLVDAELGVLTAGTHFGPESVIIAFDQTVEVSPPPR